MGSDFGSYVGVYRSDGQPLSHLDKERVRAAARSLQFTQKDCIGPYDGFDLRFGSCGAADGPEGLAVFLSARFIDDEEGNDGLSADASIADESPVAEEFAEDLSRSLGTDFRCEPYSGYW